MLEQVTVSPLVRGGYLDLRRTIMLKIPSIEERRARTEEAKKKERAKKKQKNDEEMAELRKILIKGISDATSASFFSLELTTDDLFKFQRKSKLDYAELVQEFSAAGYAIKFKATHERSFGIYAITVHW